MQIVSQAQTWYIKDPVLKTTQWKDLPVLSAAAPFKSGGRGGAEYYTDVPAGDIAIKNVVGPLPLSEHRAGGGDHRRPGQGMAGVRGHVQPGEPGDADQPLLNLDFPSYNFDVIDGVTYKIDVSQPPKYDAKGNVINAGASRIVDLTLTASRSIRRKSSSSPPTTTAPVVAATSPTSMTRSSSSSRPTPTAT